MNYKYVVFSPYFGKLPINFELWLKSCSYNKEFKFIVFTNDKRKFETPANVEIIVEEFNDFKKRIQNKFNFKIALENPYKLCDYKPFYGYIFEDMVENAEYFGYCDMDMVFGNIANFLPKENYPKISNLGHLSLIKNERKYREFFNEKNLSKIDYKDILSSNIHFGFDEIGDYGINSIFKNNDFQIYPFEKDVADVECRKININLTRYKDGKFIRDKGKRIICFEDGKIFEYKVYKKRMYKKEYAYVHFQKRKMNMHVHNESKFIITYNAFEKYSEIDSNYISSHQCKGIINLKYFKIRWSALKRKIARYNEIKKILKEKSNENN